MRSTVASHALFASLALSACTGTVVVNDPESKDPPVVVAPPPDTRTLCPIRSPEDARRGVSPTPPRHAIACTSRDFDDVGAVLAVSRRFDASGHVVALRSERMDDPPRHTFHDDVFVLPPRRFVTTTTYDSTGRKIGEATDADIDGTIDLERWWTFDAAGHEVALGVREGEAHFLLRRTYDAGGFLVLEESGTDEGVMDSTRWTRRADGEPLWSERTHAGVSDYVTEWSYDGSGKLVKSVTTSKASVRTTLFDSAKRIIEEREDNPKDGVDDWFHRITYDGSGHVIRDHEFGVGGDIRDIDETYDDKGRLSSRVEKAGANVHHETHTYDACGAETSVSSEVNGKPATISKLTMDARGFIVLEELGRPEIDTRIRRLFDTVGHLVLEETEKLQKGTWTKTGATAYQFDGAGHMVRIEVFAGSKSLSVERWTYDASGDLVVHQVSPSAGGLAREEFGYECFGP